MAGELSKAKRKKAVAQAEKVLPPGTVVRGVVVGRAQGRWSTAAITILSICGAIVLVGLALGILLFPGLILILLFGQAYRPPRGLVIADQGVATLSRSMSSGEFKDVIAFESLAALNGALAGQTKMVQVGPDVVTLSSRELKQLEQMAPQPFAGVAPAPSVDGVGVGDLASGQG